MLSVSDNPSTVKAPLQVFWRVLSEAPRSGLAVLLLLMLIGSVLESIGLVLLVPMLESLNRGNAPSDNTVIYCANPSTFYRTLNDGDDWADVTDGLPDNRVATIAVDPQDAAHLFVGVGGFTEGVKVYESTDAGDNWNNISGNLPNVPVNSLVYQTGTDDGLYVGTDLGVFYTDIHLRTNFQSNGDPNIQSGYSARMRYGLGFSLHPPGPFVIGLKYLMVDLPGAERIAGSTFFTDKIRPRTILLTAQYSF